ncbi:50S ribosomal protein L5 [Wolbachia endosymbiont of Diaphorina citri]|jgi:Ribosomal protein L5|uniref:50S ribosomal protein L5 n=1 Tax=Wolbachia endosymbiont of Diaphorina citri TaxID=116598 RepID=UPI0002EA6CF5|nr:50S ribosomal protein L5 [Wolbachia endosymbiont of Diaphorina citri]QJT94155.1 50S ribosomal protein L5 [Wolbachia endosymbiont of Diaphorina citri]QJT95396.1 50S ribosomal protein L5 [Wolbachia endosymbiont of Diaphorina citri]QJT96757.1 50S ribosomal protein L5 [Wolbachia endosymbiont of Diaphorina citri]QLK11053.1 50S ribosomal protein L5 [Wolbachia endosymbiont of Diaphorina citri]QXY87417.1 50S ribosomal protein L5 [Wolbachia endosymbiont of Diaphorina citri]
MFKQLYKDNIVKSLKDKFNYGNVMQVPKLVKVCINMGVGDAATDNKAINEPFDNLHLIAGQKPVLTFAKKSISGFKIRKGATVGCKVTLRRNKMYEFLERLIYIALPREKDFRGFSVKQFDGHGNFSFGIKEHISFLEIDYDKISKIRGMDINIITTAVSDKEAKELLLALKFPFFDN